MKPDLVIKRIQRVDSPAERSAFLWGPRKVGKTTLLRQQFADACWIDLLDYDLYLTLSRKPTQLRQIVEAHGADTVVIDEVQKIPQMMDEIQFVMENLGYRFIMSGSSARKFKRKNAHLLGGRAWRFELFPLVSKELGRFNLDKALTSGFLPSHYLSPDASMDLKAYVHDYLKEEIQAEALTRNLPAFSRFLKSAALTNGMLLNYSNAARESGVSVKTIRQYYQILEDTLIGHPLLPWKKAKKRRLIDTAKFYFFDVGIVNALLGYRSLPSETSGYGRAFEHFILQECWAYRHYSGLDFPIAFWRTASGAEVDLILGDADAAIEIKATEHVGGLPKGLHLFQDEVLCKKCYIVSCEPIPRKLNAKITILPWRHFCDMLWNGELI